MYRLGVSSDCGAYHEADYDARNSFLNPSSHVVGRQNSITDDILGGSIYDPAYYSSLFEDVRDNRIIHEVLVYPTHGSYIFLSRLLRHVWLHTFMYIFSALI